MLTETDRRAVLRYPELTRLIALRDGYRWTFTLDFQDGELNMVAGGRLWPTGWSEGIAIKSLTDARAFRLDPAAGEVWSREGSLVEVVDALVELPIPDQPGAPRLVRGSARQLWVPPSVRGGLR
jgi:hypothetical protein